mmetsp:Transcript_32837/g.50166  ORF Transcript_32837/g.50166 Transcript_32837/m.50166 type:complete len:150 (-) Transcript_32837:1593-2042(-)
MRSLSDKIDVKLKEQLTLAISRSEKKIRGATDKMSKEISAHAKDLKSCTKENERLAKATDKLVKQVAGLEAEVKNIEHDVEEGGVRKELEENGEKSSVLSKRLSSPVAEPQLLEAPSRKEDSESQSHISHALSGHLETDEEYTKLLIKT